MSVYCYWDINLMQMLPSKSIWTKAIHGFSDDSFEYLDLNMCTSYYALDNLIQPYLVTGRCDIHTTKMQKCTANVTLHKGHQSPSCTSVK